MQSPSPSKMCTSYIRDSVEGTYDVSLTMTDEPVAECWTYPPNGGVFGQGAWTVSRSGDTITIRTGWNFWPEITGTIENSQMTFSATTDEHDGRNDPDNPCYVIDTIQGTFRFVEEGLESTNIVWNSLFTDCADHCDGRIFTRTMRLDGTKQ